MAIIPVVIKRTFEVAASPQDTHALLSNVPRSASHVPEVKGVEKIDEITWRWIMNPVSYAGITMQPVYSCRYGFHLDDLRITWESAREEGQFVDVTGHWLLEPLPRGTRSNLLLDMKFDLPVPQMLVGMAQPILGGELEKQMDNYVLALTQTLGPLR